MECKTYTYATAEVAILESIQDMIKNKKRNFIGRKKELQLMKQNLHAKKEDWSILHFYAAAGMGKTVLLQHFAELHPEFPHLYIDAHQGFDQYETFLAHVYHQLLAKKLLTTESTPSHVVQDLGNIVKKYPVFILLIDGLDQCLTILPWLKDEFLNKLPINVRVYTAGRLPLDQWQTEFGWENMVRNMALKPFSKQEWKQFAKNHGITDERLIYQVGAISKGIPLAVSLTCHWLNKHGKQVALSKRDERYLIELLDKYLLSADKLGQVKDTLLVLASLTYTFDQEMMEYMLGEPIDLADFSQLCQSSFVEALPSGGWMVKNGIRNWISTSFKERFPETYEIYKERAREILDRRIATANNQPAIKLELALGKIFLQERQIVRDFLYFGGQEKLHVRAARQEELPKLAKMYQHNLLHSPPYLADDTHQEQYLATIWEAYPNAIQIIENEQQILFFYCFVPLNQEIRNIFANNPLTKNWLANTQPEEQDWFYWLVSTNQPTDWEVVHFFQQHIFLPSLSKRRITCLAMFNDQAEFLRLLGFKHAPFADFQTASGIRYYFYTLDARETTAATAPTLTNKHDPLDAWITLTKKVLVNYPVLSCQYPLLNQCNQLWNTKFATEQIAEYLSSLIDSHYERLKEGTRQEQTQAQILHYAYLKKHGSHETVAALLDLPSSTYYRHLKKLTHGLAYLLRNKPNKLS